MNYSVIKNFSIAVSLIFHGILITIFLLVNLSISYPPTKYVELTFGSGGGTGSSGALGDQITGEEQVAKEKKQTESGDKSEDEQKNLDINKAENQTNDALLKVSEKNKKKTLSKNESTNPVNSNINAPGRGNKMAGNGSFGDDIDWGGQGQRKIYNWIIPPYPEGVDKSIDIRLKFVIMPDGTVGAIIPLTKADTRLETVAINSLRQWRFEPLNTYQKQVPQTAVIIFPFRIQ